MKNISKITLLSLVVLMGTPMTFAQTTTTEPATANTPSITAPKPRQIRESAQAEIQSLKTKAQEAASATKTKLQTAREVASSTKVELKQKMETARKEIQNKRDELRNTLENRKVTLVKQWGEKTIKRLEEAVARLEKLTTRIESRIKKMKANKIDTTAADTSLVTAKQKVTEAKNALETAKLSLTDIGKQAASSAEANVAKNILSETFPKIKEQVRAVNELLKSAHQALVQTITELKGKEGVKKNNETPVNPVTAN